MILPQGSSSNKDTIKVLIWNKTAVKALSKDRPKPKLQQCYGVKRRPTLPIQLPLFVDACATSFATASRNTLLNSLLPLHYCPMKRFVKIPILCLFHIEIAYPTSACSACSYLYTYRWLSVDRPPHLFLHCS